MRRNVLEAAGRPPGVVTHVPEAGLLVWVWREPLGWAAATLRRTAHARYATPEQALAAITGAWSHETWLGPVAAAARRLDQKPITSAEPQRDGSTPI